MTSGIASEAFVTVPGGTLQVHVLESGRLAAETMPPSQPQPQGGRDEPSAPRAAEPMAIGGQRHRLRVCIDPATWCPAEHLAAQAHGWAVSHFGILVRHGNELVPAPDVIREHVQAEVFAVLARWLARHGRALLLAAAVQAKRRRLGLLEAERATLRAELAEPQTKLEAERDRTATP